MNLSQNFKMSIKQLSANKMRTALTMLGIIIGVSSITLLVSVANAMTESVNKQMSALGSNLLTVSVRQSSASERITYQDSLEFMDIPKVESITPITNGQVDISYNEKQETNSLVATTNTYKDTQNIEISLGRFILPIDVDYNNKIAVLGSKITKTLFNNQNPIDKYVRLNGISYKVVGVLKPQGNNAMNSVDKNIFVPITSGQRLVKNTSVGTLYMKADNSDDTSYILDKATIKLNKIFSNEKSYMIINQQAIQDTMKTMQNTMKTVLTSIASISLVVGGVGIMNIMLVSVSERTKEIGIRKALGAKRKTILTQFLIESIVVSLLGGIIGAIIGVVGSNVIYYIMDISGSPSISTVGLALLYSIIIGVVFGIAPANKASKLQPIDALRSE